MSVYVRAYGDQDLEEMIQVWNEVVEGGSAFPQTELLTVETGDFATEVEEIVEAQWRDLGMPETLWHCHVNEFGPLIVSIDAEGRNLFEENKVIFNQRKDKAVEEICKHVGFIK